MGEAHSVETIVSIYFLIAVTLLNLLFLSEPSQSIFRAFGTGCPFQLSSNLKKSYKHN